MAPDTPPNGSSNERASTASGPGPARARQESLLARDLDGPSNADAIYRMVLEHASDPITIRDGAGHYVDVNPAACRLLGYSRDEFLRLTVEDIAPRERNPGSQERLERIRTGETIVGERALRRSDGSFFDAENSSQLLPGGLILTISRDLTARRRAEAERLRLVAAVEQTAESVAITDADGRATYVNPAFTQLHGFTAAEIVGRRPGELVRSDAHPSEFYADADAAVAAGEPWAGRILNRRRDGGLVELDLSISPLRDGDGNLVGWVEIGRDVHRERVLEAQLRRAQKLEAVGRLAGGIAHEFNNLLTAVRGYAELINLGAVSQEEAHRFSAEIVTAADRGKALTQRLLTFARQSKPDVAVVGLNEAVLEVVQMLDGTVADQTKLVLDLSKEPLRVIVEEGQLEQALLNLVINANDAIGDSGSIGVSTRLELVDRRHRAADAGLGPGWYAVLSVTDTGIGIAPEELPRLFDPFFSTKPINLGAGLGLSIVYSVVTGAGGTVLVDSEPEAGSRFDLYLPLAADHP